MRHGPNVDTSLSVSEEHLEYKDIPHSFPLFYLFICLSILKVFLHTRCLRLFCPYYSISVPYPRPRSILNSIVPGFCRESSPRKFESGVILLLIGTRLVTYLINLRFLRRSSSGSSPPLADIISLFFKSHLSLLVLKFNETVLSSLS